MGKFLLINNFRVGRRGLFCLDLSVNPGQKRVVVQFGFPQARLRQSGLYHLQRSVILIEEQILMIFSMKGIVTFEA